MPGRSPSGQLLFTVDGDAVATPPGTAAAVSALARSALAAGAHRLELVVDQTDDAGIDLGLACGFAFEGVRRRFGRDGRDVAVFVRTDLDTGDPVPPAYPPFAQQGLTDGVIAIREAAAGDVDELYEMETDTVSLAVAVAPQPTRDALVRMLARAALDRRVGPGAQFAIVDVDSGRYAGGISVRRNGPPQVAMFGYGVHPAFRGRGYTTRALRLLSAWLFETTSTARLELGAKTDNIASQKAALAAGFRSDGVLPARLRNPDGSFSDEARFYLLRSDPATR